MKQKQIKTIPELLGSSAVIKAAAADKGPGIPLLHNTAVNIGTDADALSTACTNHDEGKVVLAGYRATMATIIFTIRAFLLLGRDILKPVFGTQYSSLYDVIGLVGSTKIPRTPQSLLMVLVKFKAYFTAHPELEDESRNITAARCQELYDQLVAAQSNVNLQIASVESLQNARNAAASKMRSRIRSLVAELTHALSPLDPRWLAFGFNMPGTVQTPEQVTGLVVTLLGPVAAMKWDAPARAGHYRVWKQVIGVDEHPVAVGSPEDTDFNVENLPSSATVDFYVSAVNDAGEGPMSVKVTLTTHS